MVVSIPCNHLPSVAPNIEKPPVVRTADNDHVRMQADALKITSKKIVVLCLFKAMSCRQYHMVQSNVHTPIQICAAVFGSILFNHVPNKCETGLGGDTLNAAGIVRHNSLAGGQCRKKC